MARDTVARRFFVHGRVQGVGFRYFAQRQAGELGVTGYARNLDDGRVEVYAAGSREAVTELARMLGQGPRWSDVRGVEELDTSLENCSGFRIKD
ncbi:MAG: acylphosphatase [Bryobacterales bacterium]|nr:acylphosphatase [Bryobacterales bacterium]